MPRRADNDLYALSQTVGHVPTTAGIQPQLCRPNRHISSTGKRRTRWAPNSDEEAHSAGDTIPSTTQTHAEGAQSKVLQKEECNLDTL